ncbi:peptidoglycan-binding protein [Bacillus cereus]|uniref:peptidoglycan-binding domain-containing protein n=1 Tax=Bacillus cereus TaxID=1396 RepID=UPI0018F78D8C|nr:peptidoglycan-binding domain-containing protein [Bacillus cereus]MBJ8056101.1 peptidoglycan-binding protein [Bacillus cereus]
MDQVRRIDFNDERVGMGFNSESGLAIGTALEGFTVTADPIAPGQQVSASVSIINSHDELMERLGMSFEAKGRYGFFSASAKAEFSSSTSYNSTSTFVVARCVVKNPFMRGDNFRVKQPAQDLLNSLRFDEFRTAYGDSFVRGLQTGGEFYAVIRITSFSTSKQKELGVTLQGEMNGVVTNGEFKTQYTQANASTHTRSEYSATMFQRAGSGSQISPVVEITELINRYKSFPQIALNSAFAYEAEVATYNTLPLPVPTPVEQENFLLSLRDAQDKKLYYIQKKNDLEFARKNPMFFENLPPDDVLSDAISVYTKLINAVMDHGNKLSRGEMRPPRIFDPSVLSPPINEPASIQLKRATPSVPTTLLRIHDRGELVKLLQESLKRAGFYQVGEVDGKFGYKTLEAVRAFQRANNLVVDGIVGPMTWQALSPYF